MLSELDTFIKFTGPVKERMQKSTGLSADEFCQAQTSKKTRLSVDLLVPSVCNQACSHCFFVEGNTFMPSASMETVVRQIEQLTGIFDLKDVNLTIYPREITTVMALLPVMEKTGQDRVLTNGMRLSQPETLDQLLKFGIKRVAVSIHGDEAQQTRLTQAPPEFYQQTLRGIQQAVKRGIKVETFTTVYQGNVDILSEIFTLLAGLGVAESRLIRITPTGRGVSLADSEFISKADILKVLYQVNRARKKYPDLKITLFPSFGPNFYSGGIYRYLAGKTEVWPTARYYCPWIGQDFLGISLKTSDVYPCFEALSFPELKLGQVSKGKLQITQTSLDPQELRRNLTGICSTDNCQYQSLCLGGCRITAFAFAKRKGIKDPLYAGMDLCITKILDEIISNKSLPNRI